MKNMREMDHVLLTRFNLPTGGVEERMRNREGWLRDRVQLFERYCLPSVKAQTSADLHWVIYFDPESPAWLKLSIDLWAASGAFRPIFRSSVSNTELVADLRETVGNTSKCLLTTNLDNDDALAPDFAETLQGGATQVERTALFMPRGLIVADGKVYWRIDRRNAFCSVIESWHNPVTCWTDWHNLLDRHMPVCELNHPPAWIQIVHGGNVSNRIHGRLVAPAQFQQRFPGLLTNVPKPTKSALLWDNYFLYPARACRDRIRNLAKVILLSFLGRGGLDKLKSAASTRRGTPRDDA